MSDARLKVLLVGIGGYGNSYVNMLLDTPHQDRFVIVGASDPAPASCRRLTELQARDVAVFPSIEAFYEAGLTADLAIISTPPHMHAEHTELALSHGSHVLCEKPLCVTPEDADRMLAAQRRSSKHVAIGYQWSFSKVIGELKSQIASGAFGRATRLRTLVLWPRDESYFSRNRWAGVIKDAKGNCVLDGPVNNACAHYLHNMLYMLGERADNCIVPETITAELYRGHQIENYDTAAIRCRRADDVQLLFIASHCTAESRGPVLQYEFENATIEYMDEPGASFEVRTPQGTRRYGSPNEDRTRKFLHTLDVIEGKAEPLCGIEAASAHAKCVWAAQQCVSEITTFPADRIQTTGPIGKRKTFVKGLGEQLQQCYDQWKLPSELGFDWASPAAELSLSGAIELNRSAF